MATSQRQAVTGIPRLLVLVAVVCGIWLMHTLGHATMHDGPGCHANVAAAQDSGAVGHGSGGGCGDGGQLDPLSTCLAVLVGLGLVAGGIRLVLLTGRPSTWSPLRQMSRSSRPLVRGPPILPGLAMTKVAVLRT